MKNKVLYFLKKISFEDEKFEKYPVFQNARNAISDNLIPPQPASSLDRTSQLKILATGLFIS